MADDDQTLSTEVASAVENAPSPSATDDKSPSSGDTSQGETKESLLEAVQKAVPELRKDADRDSDGADGDSPAQVAKDKSAEDEPELPEEPTPEELAKLSKTAQRRIKKLNSQRQRLAGEVERLQPSAKAAEQVTQYLRTNDIGQDDFLMGLELMSAMRRGDFKTFYEGVKPYMRLCEEYLGVALPPDLQQKVSQGHMTTQAAAMYSKERMDRAMAQTNAARQQAALQQHQQQSVTQQQAQQKQILASQVANTVNAWEAQVARTDPDYAAKKNAVQNTMWAVVREQGVPQSPDHAVLIAKEAYKRVNEQYRAWTPQRRPTSRSPSSTGRTAGGAPEPKSLMEAVKFAREGGPRL